MCVRARVCVRVFVCVLNTIYRHIIIIHTIIIRWVNLVGIYTCIALSMAYLKYLSLYMIKFIIE